MSMYGSSCGDPSLRAERLGRIRDRLPGGRLRAASESLVRVEGESAVS